MKLLDRIKNHFSKDYCHICKKAFKNYRGYRHHVLTQHTNMISDEGVVIYENA